MARPFDPDRVKLLCATLSGDADALRTALVALGERFGPLDYQGSSYPFDATNYYEAEMGALLERRLVSFRDLVLPDSLVDAKEFANGVEDSLRTARARRVNLDIGYLDSHKLILASCKPGRPKVYLARGIYADPIGFYAKGSFMYPEATFADFSQGLYDRDLLEIRARYRTARRSGSNT